MARQKSEHSKRIQTSILNGLERKALIWMAERMPRWVKSDYLTILGTIGAFIVALGYILTHVNINFLWLSSFGLIVNWFGDSLDGTLARVRHTQRPIYGFYFDHTMDIINECLMFMGAGLSVLMRFDITLLALVVYLMLTINVTVDAHLKNEFRLTYAGLGPTEFRLIVILVNAAFALIRPLREYSSPVTIFGKTMIFTLMDYVVSAIVILLSVLYVFTIVKDAMEYSKMDPMPKDKDSEKDKKK